MAESMPPPTDDAQPPGPTETYRILSTLPESIADDETLVKALTFEVMNWSCDLADRDPGEAAWDELEETVGDVLRFLSRAAAVAAEETA